MKILYIFAIIVLIHTTAKATYTSTPELILQNRQLITPSLSESANFSTMPSKFNTSNSLRRKTGSPFIAKGQFILLEGFVVDLLGIPIENTKIKIWQTNNFGYYNYLVTEQDDYSQYDQDFEPTGTTITDETGYYRFFTIIPGFFGKFAPYINIIIEHDDFEKLQTIIFFEKHPKNISDIRYRSLNKNKRNLITCIIENIDDNEELMQYGNKKCIFNIRLDGLHKRRRI